MYCVCDNEGIVGWFASYDEAEEFLEENDDGDMWISVAERYVNQYRRELAKKEKALYVTPIFEPQRLKGQQKRKSRDKALNSD